MQHLDKEYLPRLNAFSELLKDTHRIHADHIREMGGMQKELGQEIKLFLAELHSEKHAAQALGRSELAEKMQAYESYCLQLEKSLKAYRFIYQQHITDTNFQLGQFGTSWGGYIEQLAVQYIQNLLRSEYGAHTFMQRFKRFWHKSRNVEIDLLALSDTHAYILEVKNQLKEETFIQMLTIMDKIKTQLPTIAALRIQPVFVCIHAEDRIVNTATMAGIWVLRYKGFDAVNATNEFEWLRRDEQT